MASKKMDEPSDGGQKPKPAQENNSTPAQGEDATILDSLKEKASESLEAAGAVKDKAASALEQAGEVIKSKAEMMRDAASGAIDDAMSSEAVTSAKMSLQKAGEVIAESGRNALDSGASLLRHAKDLSVLLGVAAGVGVWWLMSGPGESSDSGEVAIKTHEPGKPSLMGRASHVVESITESASSVGTDTMQKMQGMVSDMRESVENNPWAYLTGGMLVGGLLAVLIPPTKAEARIFGMAHEAVVEKAAESIQSGVQMAKEKVVEAAVQAVTDQG